MELEFKTKGILEPKGKPRVLFACHPADYEDAFEKLTGDILEVSNCAIWYYPDQSYIPDKKELEDIVQEMQLVVIAVTSVFLHEENPAREMVLPIALEKHVPILPVLMENGLGGEFSRTCAKIQVVRRNEKDPTATPYSEVLERFLKATLIGDEQAALVRDAFDAYVFLSYRKKDRKHAHRLMELIHNNKEYRDIAIWYDEFLIPGEGFRKAIFDALQKSSIFAMAVTPHLTETGNFVMKEEYPRARNRQKKDRSYVVVPVELYQDEDRVNGKDWRIDQSLLIGQEDFEYQRIEDLKDEHRLPELTDTFISALDRIAKKTNDGSSTHRFFIGLAFLYGIDVEKNLGIALEQLTSAANDQKDPCFEATKKLAEMYSSGDGVKADQKEAVRWQEKLAEQYLNAYEKNHDPDEHKGYGTKYFKALRRLSELQQAADIKDEPFITAEKALAFCSKLEEEVGIREMMRDKALILNRLGSMCRDARRYDDAEKYLKQACEIYEKQAAEITTQRIRRDLSISYERLGDLARKREDLDKAETYYIKSRDIRMALHNEDHSVTARRDLSAVYTKLGNVFKSRRQYKEAFASYAQALYMDRVLLEETKTVQAKDDYGVSLSKIGDIHKAEGRYDKGVEVYGQACDLFKENVDKTGSRDFMDHRASCLDKLASVKKRLGEKEEAERLYRESIDIRKELYEASDTPENTHLYAAACYNTGAFLEDRELIQKAFDLWDGICVKHPQYVRYREKARKLL